MGMSGNRLADRHILITGGASGMGYTTAELFIAEGAKVFILDANAKALDAAKQSLKCGGACADVTDAGAVKSAVTDAEKHLGALDGLVNAAGIFGYSRINEFTGEQWQRMLNINLVGPALVIQAALPALQKAERATIVNCASVQGLQPAAGSSAYASSKAGLITMTQSMAKELGPKIRVNSVCPGAIDTPMLRASLSGQNLDTSLFALKRVGQPLEIAQGVLYLSSDESSYVTGIALAIDGGRSFH